MSTAVWPALRILHPWQDAPEPPNYVPYSTKIVGWALDPRGPCRVELRFGGRLIASTVADIEESHPSAIASGGAYYRKSCGFSFSLDTLVDTDDSTPVHFVVRAISRDGDYSEYTVLYAKNEQDTFLRIKQESLNWEQASIQKLLLHSFYGPSPVISYVFSQIAEIVDRPTYVIRCKERATKIAQFFPLSERKFYVLGEDVQDSTSIVTGIRFFSDLSVRSKDFVIIIDPDDEWTYSQEIGSINESIVRRFEVGRASKGQTDQTALTKTGLCLCGDEFSAFMAENSFSLTATSRVGSDREPVLGVGDTFISVNGPICDPRRIMSILIIKLDRIGDVISMVPALRQLRQLFPNAQISAFVTSYTAPIIQTIGVVDEILIRDNDRLPPYRLWDLAVDLRLDADTRSVLLDVKAHLKVSVRPPSEVEPSGPKHFTIASQLPSSGPPGRQQTQHVMERLGTLVGALATNLCGFFPDKNLSSRISNHRSAYSTINGYDGSQPYLIVAPGPPHDVRSWPTDRLANLAARCADNFGLVVKLVGTQAEAGECATVEQFLSHTGISCVNLCAKLSPEDLVSIVRWSSFFIGVDSGPKHIACLFGIPGISIHGGRHSPRVWGGSSPTLIDVYSPVSCSPCLVMKIDACWNGLLCLSNIAVDHAWNAAVIAWALDSWRAKHQ